MFALCVEASHSRGMGHLFRALALASALERREKSVVIYVNRDAGAARVLSQAGREWKQVTLYETHQPWEAELIRGEGVKVWVNDRFETGAEHAKKVKAAGAVLVTFDDSGTGAAFADLHVCALPLGESAHAAGRRVLTGLNYLVLDPAIRSYRRLRSELNSLVVSMGGSDTYGLTLEVLRALQQRELRATLLIGPGFVHDEALRKMADSNYVVKRSVPSMAEELAKHDLAITAGGMTAFEANAAGLPCIAIAAEPWEEHAARQLAKLGGCRYAGPRGRIDFSVLDERLPVGKMSAQALAMVPADGADTVVDELLKL